MRIMNQSRRRRADFDPLQYIDRKEARRMDRYCQLPWLPVCKPLRTRFDIASYGAKRVGTIIGSSISGLNP